MKKRKAPGELELVVTAALKKLKKASVATIVASLDDQYAYTTILTILSRMYKKKLVEREKHHRQYLYSLVKKKSAIIEKIKETLFEGRTAAMVHYLIDTSEKISESEIKELEALIKKHKK